MKVTILGNYPPHAYKGLIQGSDREAAIKAILESVGGKVSGMMFTRGAYDIVVNAEVPDQADGMDLALAVRASGWVNDLVVLEELDMKAVLAAAKRLPAFTSPPADWTTGCTLKAARFRLNAPCCQVSRKDKAGSRKAEAGAALVLLRYRADSERARLRGSESEVMPS
ncbi:MULTISPECIES: GYD domain-containing protein [unclassified Mesorhizobium]|uniref:GYD domain-containing protein n=1 Tax=unclassified Mesorhizobium TaxID=325217 RepID=UPI00333597F4